MIIGTALIVLVWVLFVGMGLPVWAGVLLTILGSFFILFGLLFGVYFFNIDSKLLAVVQKGLNKVYDKRKRNRHLE